MSSLKKLFFSESLLLIVLFSSSDHLQEKSPGYQAVIYCKFLLLHQYIILLFCGSVSNCEYIKSWAPIFWYTSNFI